MALGDQAGLQAVQALTATFPGLLAAIGGDADKLTAALAQIEQDAIMRAGSVIQADLAPALAESAAWRTMTQKILDCGIEGTIGGIPFTIKATPSNKP